MRAEKSPSIGKITRGIKRNTLVDQTITFVERQLPSWRDDKTRERVEAEEDLNGQLCKFLNNCARDEFPMAIFHHEEKQGKRRRVDLSALPSSKAIEAGIYNSIYRPILVMEGKRLPPPTAAREREYITGLEGKSGGIQRFRLGLHGKAHSMAMLIGYVQSGNVSGWHKTLNDWIKALKDSGEDKTCTWAVRDNLGKMKSNGKRRASRCESSHTRIEDGSDIHLIHLWICMGSIPAKKNSAA